MATADRQAREKCGPPHPAPRAAPGRCARRAFAEPPGPRRRADGDATRATAQRHASPSAAARLPRRHGGVSPNGSSSRVCQHASTANAVVWPSALEANSARPAAKPSRPSRRQAPAAAWRTSGAGWPGSRREGRMRRGGRGGVGRAGRFDKGGKGDWLSHCESANM
eukprot:363324-Chlamydomonas_euryale.AAC.19